MLFNKFFNCETLDAFNLNLESGDITDQCIVFIEDTKQIWTHGQFYSCPYTKEEIDDLINSVDTDITKEDIEKVLTGNITSHTHNQYLTSYTETDPTVPAWAKAASKPSYSYSEITNTPTSLKNPTSITIQGNGTSLGSYDGSEAKTINLTYSNVGAAAASHTHTKSQITDFPSTLPNANALTLKINSGTTEGTNLYTYTGSSVKSLDIKAGSNITLTASSGTLTISSSYTNTTYSAGTGLSLSGTTFSLGTSGVTAGSYGPTANVSGSNGTTINVPQITVDSYGRVTGVTNRVYTSVDTNTTYSLSSFGVTATAAQLNFCSGVTSNIQTQLNNKAASSHTHTNIVSRGNVTAETGVTGRPAVEGLSMSLAYSNGYPASYGNVISLRGQGDGQIFVGWSGTDGAHAPVYVRSKRDNVTTANWSPWAQFYTSANPQPSVTGSSGSCTGNSATATKLATARTISLTGSVTGSASFDGSANISISTSIANLGGVVTITKSLQLTTDWMDTGILCSQLGNSGTYAVQVGPFSDRSVGSSQYSEYYSGIMSSYSGGSNSSAYDEIPLHRCGHAPNSGCIYLRILRVGGNTSSPKIQIASAQNYTSAYSITFKFRQLI